MYPKNAASPERIAVGPVVQISDGAVQTSGVSITVVPQGGTTAAGGGTTSYEQGVVFYLPTQAETNYTSFIVTAYKTGCIPTSTTVVTTASATAGKVVLSGETHTSAVIPTVTTLTGHTAQTGDAFARLGAPSTASISGDLIVLSGDIGAVSDKIGTPVGVDLVADVAAVKVDTAAIDARIPAALVGGRMDVSVGAMAANVLTAAATAADFGAEVADAVWDEAIAGHLTAGSVGVYTAVGGGILVDGSATGTPTSTSFTFAGGSTSNGFYNDQTVYILSGTGLGQARPILSSTYSGGTTTIVVDEAFAVTMAASDRFVITSSHVHPLSQIADKILLRKLDRTGDGTDAVNERTVVNALRAVRNKVSISGGTATVTKEDDTTTAWTASVATTAGDPISSIDPA